MKRPLDQRGFSLMEVIVAMVIAVIAVLGLAHSFAAGRSLIDRYETARTALAYAQGRVETLAGLAAHQPGDASLATGWHGPTPVNLGSRTGGERWFVEWKDDPVDKLGPLDATPNDYKRVTMYVFWTQGSNTDTVSLARTMRSP